MHALSLVVLLAGIIGYHPAFSEVTNRYTLPFNSGFDEIGGRYVWRGSAASAALEGGGEIVLTFSNHGVTRLTFPRGNRRSAPVGERQLNWRTHYYVGATHTSRSSQSFERVRYHDIYPGTDLVVSARAQNLELEFEVGVNADLSRITMRYDDAKITLNSGGVLEISTAGQQFTQSPIRVFRSDQGAVRSIPCDYLLGPDGLIGFQVATLNRRATLVIDPILNFSTFVGGASEDSIHAVAADRSGNVYVTGSSSSASLTGGFALTRSSPDAFVAKLDASGSPLWVVYLGGSGDDRANGIAVDAQGNAYITGATSSADFPATSGAIRTQLNGTQAAFVFKLNSAGTLIYSTLLGGGASESGFGITVDSSQSAYVAGSTTSLAFPVTPGVFQSAYGGGAADCFVSKLNNTGTAFVYSTFLGGSSLDVCSGVSIDAAGNAYVTGTTYSANYPTQTPLRSTLGGTATAFVTELNPTASALIYSTYLGGGDIDNGKAIAVDSSGAAYVAGASTSTDFPTTPLAFQGSLRGLYNAFVSKISPGGTALSYSTLIGGSGVDAGTSIAVDAVGRVVLGGYTTSIDFPTLNANQAELAGSFDAFVTVLNPQGTGLLFSSYFGGTNDDRAYAVLALPAAQLYLAGVTSSFDFPNLNADNAQSAPDDGFLLRLTYITPHLLLQDDATTQIAEWILGGPQGASYQAWTWLSAGDMTGWRLAGLADMNGDGVLDVIWQNASTRQVAVWYMGGSQGNVYRSWAWLSAGAMPGWTLVAIADFNKDGHPDLVWQNDATRQQAVWYMGGPDGNLYQSWAWLSAGTMTGWTVVGVADFNGDGSPDLVWQNEATGQVAVWYMAGAQGNSYQSWAWLGSGTMAGWHVGGITDLNNDGHPDLVWQNTATRAITAWFLGGPQGGNLLSTATLSQGLPGWTVQGTY